MLRSSTYITQLILQHSTIRLHLCLMSPMPVLIRKGTPSQRALSMYNAAAKKVGVRLFKFTSTLSPEIALYCPRMTSLGSNLRIDLKTFTWKGTFYYYGLDEIHLTRNSFCIKIMYFFISNIFTIKTYRWLHGKQC